MGELASSIDEMARVLQRREADRAKAEQDVKRRMARNLGKRSERDN